MAFHCQSSFPVDEAAMVSPTSTCDATSSRILACLSSLNHSPSFNTMPVFMGNVRKMEETAIASRMAAQMALTQIRIARDQQALALCRYPFLLNQIMEQRSQNSLETTMNPGMDAFRAAAMIQQRNLSMSSSYGLQGSFGRQLSISSASNADTLTTSSNENLDDSINDESEDSYTKTYVENVSADDVLCGRGGRSNHHIGNKRYRLVVAKMKYLYQKCAAKTMKTDLSRAIVKHCTSYGARFLKLDESNGKYYILSKGEARKKTSQALREAKVLKWVN
jgi:hypothetical protein